jgi:predicted AlkP superfamily pyrophosphatase or phosphodiesterase
LSDDTPEDGVPLAKRIVLIVADGLRPDAINCVPTPCIDDLRAEGSSCWHAITVRPSGTLTCHASMFFSVPHAMHGVEGERWPSPRFAVPGIADLVIERGGTVDLFYSWAPLRQITVGESRQARHHYQTVVDPDDDLALAADASARIGTGRATLTFVYLQTPDLIGHDQGWMSAPYLDCVRTIDRAVGMIVDAAIAGEEDTAVLFLADHGGVGRGHTVECTEVITIPWLVAGPGVRRGHRIAGPVGIMDTAPTIARLLGIAPPPDWQGKAITDALIDHDAHAD